MKLRKGGAFLSFLSFLISQSLLAHSLTIHVQNQPSAQRGAKLFMNYCSGCHSLTYVRYEQIAQGLGLTNSIQNELLKNNLIFTKANLHDPVHIALPKDEAKRWFGVVPPDLSLIAREKGVDWLLMYLNSFYKDDSRPFGTNNRLVPNAAMPDILSTMKDNLPNNPLKKHLKDLVTFLDYVGEPVQEVRYRLGFFVLGFLFVLFLVVLSLKKLYILSRKPT